MLNNWSFWLLLACLLGLALGYDVATRRIPNWLVLAGAIAGVSCSLFATQAAGGPPSGVSGLGLGKWILDCLAEYARERHVGLLRLETGIYQTEAIGLYERYGFQRRSPFGEYRDDPLSVYFEKPIT